LIAATTVYATLLFVVLSEFLIRGSGQRLTAWRGEKWAKELDYIYLTFDAVGLVMSTNRLDVIDQKLSLLEYVGPFVLATALVVRALKTRVERADIILMRYRLLNCAPLLRTQIRGCPEANGTRRRRSSDGIDYLSDDIPDDEIYNSAAGNSIEFVHAQLADFIVHVILLLSGEGGIPISDPGNIELRMLQL